MIGIDRIRAVFGLTGDLLDQTGYSSLHKENEQDDFVNTRWSRLERSHERMKQEGSRDKRILQERKHICFLFQFCHHRVIQGDHFTNHKGETLFILSYLRREWRLRYNPIGSPTSERERERSSFCALAISASACSLDRTVSIQKRKMMIKWSGREREIDSAKRLETGFERTYGHLVSL